MTAPREQVPFPETMATTSCECGLTYVPGVLADERLHRRMHTEYSRGPAISSIYLAPRLGVVDDLTVHLVDEFVPFDARRKLAHVAMVAQRTMPRYLSGYDGAITEDNQHLYLLAKRNRAVAFVLSSLAHRFWRLKWTMDFNIELVENAPDLRTGHRVGRVWVASNYRRKGLAKKLVEFMLAHRNQHISLIGWELPFTESGRELVRSLAPLDFLGCGDIQAVRKTIHSQ